MKSNRTREAIRHCCIVDPSEQGRACSDVQGRRDGLGSVTDRQEEPSAVAHGFFFWCIRVVKLGAEALDVNAMMPGRFCPAFLIDLQHVACAANPSVVVGRPLGLDSLVVAAGVRPPLFPPPNRTVGCEAAPRPVEDRPQSGLHTAFAIASRRPHGVARTQAIAGTV